MEECPRVADWLVEYPAQPDADQTWRLLQSMLLVNWDWDQFIWDLRELLRLLTRAPPEFNYLFVTDFLKARAAYLAATESFNCAELSVLVALGTKRVQFASIYYRLLVDALRDVLEGETGSQLLGDLEERLFQLTIREVERRYIEILELIALDSDSVEEAGEEIYGQSLESWVLGAVRQSGQWRSAVPADVEVPAVTEVLGRHRVVRPGRRDMMQKIRKREKVRLYRQRTGDMRRTDIEMETLSRFVKVSGYPVMQYGDLSVQYYLTLTNPEKTILYVVCADRTMRIYQRDEEPLGTKPRVVELLDDEDAEDLYIVSFDSGAVGLCAIDFRPHKLNERAEVPEEVLRPRAHACRCGCLSSSDCVEPDDGQVDKPQRPPAGNIASPPVSATGANGSGVAGKKDLADLRDHLDRKLDYVAGDVASVRRENEDLKAMQAGGLFNFVERAEVGELRLFFAILRHGDQSKAARALGISDTTFRRKTRRWRSMDRPYRVMHRLIDWRKKVGRKVLVPFNDEILSEAHGDGDLSSLLCDVMEGLRAMNGRNWEAVRDELEEAVRDECG